MRLSDIKSDDILLKLRKGAAGSLDAKKLSEVFERISGWSIEKITTWKKSDGGKIIDTIPELNRLKKSYYKRSNDDRVHYYATIYTHEDASEYYRQQAMIEDQQKVDEYRMVVYPFLKTNPKSSKWMITNAEINEYEDKERWYVVDVSFDFFVKMNAYKITSPDGQEYEVYGDYKNGAIDPHTFQDFYDWAKEETDFIEQINQVLGMQPVEKKHDPKEKWYPPPTSTASTKIVFDILSKMVEPAKEEYFNNTKQNVTNTINKFMADVKENKEVLNYLKGSFGFIIQRVFDSRTKQLVNDWQQQVDDLVQQETEEVANMFVYKNTRKLAAILDAKGNYKEYEILGISTSKGAITGSVKFMFDDGSEFTVNNNVVVSWTPVSQRFFYRFPTTFHDVILRDGTRMAQPSEERMNTVFVNY